MQKSHQNGEPQRCSWGTQRKKFVCLCFVVVFVSVWGFFFGGGGCLFVVFCALIQMIRMNSDVVLRQFKLCYHPTTILEWDFLNQRKYLLLYWFCKILLLTWACIQSFMNQFHSKWICCLELHSRPKGHKYLSFVPVLSQSSESVLVELGMLLRLVCLINLALNLSHHTI